MRALWAEWGKTWSVRAPLLCLLGTVTLAVITAAALANDFVRGIGAGEFPSDAVMTAASAVGPAAQFGLLIFIGFAMILITPEYATGSIQPTFQAEPRRGVVLAGKAIIGLVAGALSGAAVGVMALTASDFALQEHAAAASENPAVTVLRVSGLFAVAAVLVVALGAIVRSSAGTLACGAVLLVGTLALPPELSIWTPGGGAGEFIEARSDYYPSILGLAVLTAWAATAYLAAVWLLRRRDA